MERFISVQQATFNVEKEYLRLKRTASSVGAVTMFVGTVRDINDDQSVSRLHLEHYPGMTEMAISDILAEADTRWEIISATVIHRIGELVPSDDIVFVGVSSKHRGDAFDACEFVIDYLKTKATFWKKELTKDGDHWLTTRETDFTTAENWRVGQEALD